MKNVVALFSNAGDADTAIKKLGEADLDIGRAQVHSRQTIESSTNVRAMPSANAGLAGGAGTPGTAGTGGGVAGGAILSDDSIESYLDNRGVDGEELAFYTHGVKEGGHIVIISVDNDEVEKAKKTLADAGGRAPTVE